MVQLLESKKLPEMFPFLLVLPRERSTEVETAEQPADLQADVEGGVSRGPDGAEHLLWSQRLHLQRLQPPALIGYKEVERFPRSQLREGGPQQLQEVRLLQTPGTPQVLDRTFLKHWSKENTRCGS